MTWSLAGWALIGFAAITLSVFSLLYKSHTAYRVRHKPAAKALLNARTSSIERGQRQQIVLGHRLWSQTYPGLGLHSLSVLPTFLDPEAEADGGLSVSTGDGSLVLFARQIIHNRYQGGFSTALHDRGVSAVLPGPTPWSFTAGLLVELVSDPHGSLALFGNYGPEALLWTEAVYAKGGHVLAAAGTIESQAALYLSVRDLLIGENIFMMPGLINPNPKNSAGWLAEDLLRNLLILLLIAAAILKMVGVL